jgi:chromosome partition protein MukE
MTEGSDASGVDSISERSGAERYVRLQDVVDDELFPEVDLALRRGEHVDVSDPDRYAFLRDVQRHLEAFYLRYGCQLVQADGYFFLLPQGDRLGRRHLSTGEMLVGQTLALLLLDPATLRTQGVVGRQQVAARLAQLVGEERLVQALNPRRRRRDQRVAHETVRRELDKAVRSLATLGFVEIVGEDDLRLKKPLLRFTEPVRGAEDPTVALERLVSEGRLTLDVGPGTSGDAEGGLEADADADASSDGDGEGA